jgi:hypothetical protein
VAFHSVANAGSGFSSLLRRIRGSYTFDSIDSVEATLRL